MVVALRAETNVTPQAVATLARSSLESSLFSAVTANAVVPVAQSSREMSAATAREVMRFARAFDNELTTLTKPYYVPVPTLSDLGGMTAMSVAAAYIGLPLVTLGLKLFFGGPAVYEPAVFLGVIALGPIGWTVSLVDRMRQKNPQATPLEAQSLRDMVSAAVASTPLAQAIAAEVVATRLFDEGVAKAFDKDALPIVRALAAERSTDGTLRGLVKAALLLNRGPSPYGAENDRIDFREVLEPLPAEAARAVREQHAS